MSLAQIANHLKSEGRGPDSQLVHMSTQELQSLQALAQKHGGSLTVNPKTGLPEAGFLDSILPTVLGVGASILMPEVSPLLVGGVTGAATGAITGNLQKGLMAGLGAWGGASLGGSLMGSGSEALTAASGAIPQAAQIPDTTAGSFDSFGAPVQPGSAAATNANAAVAAPQALAPSAADKLSAGFSQMSKDPMSFLKQNMFPIGAAVAPMLMDQSNTNASANTASTGNPMIRPYRYAQTMNPQFGAQPGQPYFNQSMTAQTPYAAKEGGAIRFDSGGLAALTPTTQRYSTPTTAQDPSVAAYNSLLMQRANQEYNNSPQLAAFRANPPPTPAQAVAQTTPTPPAAPTPATLALNPYGDLSSTQAWQQQAGGGGAANGGLMRAYAMGGGIGGYTPSPDDGQGAGVHPTDTGITGAHPSVSMGPAYPMQGTIGSFSDGGQLLKGPGDGISDSIPAQIGQHQPARLADGEFVVPARIVSELGNGSTDAGAKRLYEMMDRIQKRRSSTVGKGNIAVDSGAHKELNRL